jgi:hypothetical protein
MDPVPLDVFREFCAFMQWACEEVRAGRLEAGPHNCRYGPVPADIAKASSAWWSRRRTDGEGRWREH